MRPWRQFIEERMAAAGVAGAAELQRLLIEAGTDVSRQVVWRWITDAHRPSWSNFQALAGVLGFDPMTPEAISAWREHAAA